MIDLNILKSYRRNSVDYNETMRLRHQISIAKHERNPFFLNFNEFDQILRWKLRNQYGRQKALRNGNTESIIESITLLAFRITHTDKNYELELRLNLLTTIRGVGIGVASAILALCYPGEYAVVDFRGWRQIFGTEKSFFTINDYVQYLKEIKKLARTLNWLPQEVDLAIWEYDRVRNQTSINKKLFNNEPNIRK